MTVKVFEITLFILLPYVCGFMENFFATHSTHRTYQRILHNEHHQGNSLLNDITPYGLQLQKHAQIDNISEDFPAKWLNILHKAERKLVNLLLEETS